MMGNDDFKITREEFNKFKEAMKKDEFKKLFFDYLDEISDPQNRQKYEEEIAMLEKERGNNIRWIKPEGQFVVKTKYDKNQVKAPLIQSPQRQKTIDQTNSFSSIDIKPGLKVFINICQSSEIKDATLQKSNVVKNNSRGQSWSIPYSLTYGRNDKDKANNDCVVYDCIFSPNTIRMASNYRFKELIIMTAIEGIERQFNVKLEKKYKIPKMKCKGTPQDTVIREKSGEENNGETSKEFIERLYKENKDKLSTDKTKTNSNSTTEKKVESKTAPETKKKPLIEELDGEVEFTNPIETPKYKIVHRGEIQISDFVNDRQYTHNNRPSSLLITIELPKMVRQSEADLEITEKTLDLYVKDKYKLNIQLPYEIIEDEGTATFDRKNRNLVLNLPVVPQKELLVETSKDENVPIEVMDENGNPIKSEDPFYSKSTEEVQEKNENTENSVENEDKEAKEENGEENKEEEDTIKKITDYAVVLYENAKIPYAKIHQTMEQLEVLLYIPEVSLSTIETKFLGNTFYLEARSQKDNQLYQYLIKLAAPVHMEECGFMVVDTPDDRDINEEEKEESKPGITRTVKAVKCLIPKIKSEWWSNNVFEIRPKLESTTSEGNTEDSKDSKEETKKPLVDYIYKDGEINTELFDFKEKIFLTENFVNKLDELLTKQEKEPKNKKEDEMPQWLRDAINPPKKENKVIELTEEDLATTETATEVTTTKTTKATEPEITLKANELIFDLDDIDF